jgi:hypothetical protein
MPTEMTEEERKLRARDLYLQRTYKVTLAEWLAVFAYQGEVCAICKKTGSGKRAPHTDHDHKTGLFRGIVCFFCNAYLLRQRITPQLLRDAADYLENPPAVAVLGERFGPTGRINAKPRRRRRRKRATAASKGA